MNGAFTLDEITYYIHSRMAKTNGLLMSLKPDKLPRLVLFAFTYTANVLYVVSTVIHSVANV